MRPSKGILRAARKAVAMVAVAGFPGHANVNTTRVYRHWADESVKRTVADG